MSTYDTLSLQAAQGRIFFRVWDDTSPSPLIWTGDSDTSGFKCHHPIIGSYTPSEYAKATVNLRMSKEHSTRSMGDSLLYHTMYHHQQHFEAELNDTYFHSRMTSRSAMPKGLGPDVWIHAYRDLNAAIERIGQLLDKKSDARLHLTVLRRVTGGLESWTEVAPHLLRALPRRNDRRMKKLIQKAIVKARSGGDHAYYGRVFSRSIVEDLVWTRDRAPFEIPCHPPTCQVPLASKPEQASTTMDKRDYWTQAYRAKRLVGWKPQNKRVDQLRLQKLQKEDKAVRFQAFLGSEISASWSDWMLECLGKDVRTDRQSVQSDEEESDARLLDLDDM